MISVESRGSRVESTIAVVIPALDEEDAIAGVVAGLVALKAITVVRERTTSARSSVRAFGPSSFMASDGRPLIDSVVVADNGSRDRTAERARAAGAVVVFEPQRGYGAACLAGIAYLRDRAAGRPDIVVFVDGDGSNDLADLSSLLSPIVSGEAELVIGSRVRRADVGSLTFPQQFGNVLASRLMNLLYGMHYTDLGPFRALSWDALTRLEMSDRDYGWTVEMQIKAAQRGVPVREVDVGNKPRVAGRSKVAGTIRGVVGAGYKIIYTILRYR